MDEIINQPFDVFAIAEVVAEILNHAALLPEGTEAKADPVPEFELEETDVLQVPVSPSHVYLEDQSRSERKHRLIIQIAFLKHVSGKQEIPVLVNALQRIAGWFRHETFTAGAVQCHVVDSECDPIYDPEEFREKHEFFGVVILEIESYETLR